MADIYGLQVGDIICKPTGDGSELEDARSFIQLARGSGRIARSVNHPLIVEVLRDVGGERKLFRQKGSGIKNPFNILVPANAKIVVDEDSSEDEDDRSPVASNPVIDHVLRYLGVDPRVDDDEGGTVAGVMDMGDDVAFTRSNTIAQSIASAKRAKAEEMLSRDFRKEWDRAINVPIEEIGRRFSRLSVGGRPVKVYPRVGPGIEKELHDILSKLDKRYKPEFTKSEDLKHMPAISAWMDAHCLILPYSISILRCKDEKCCGKFRSPAANGVRDLVTQRQPTPIMDNTNKNRKNHFFQREEALRLFGDSEKALSDLSDLPSKKPDKKNEKKTKDDRDATINAKLKLKSWEPKKVRGVMRCYFCNKYRCFFSREKDSPEYREAVIAWQQKLESIDHRYSCGDLLFDDDHPVANIIAQRQQLTCESQIEKAYYNHAERALKLVDICIHCGDEGSSEYLFGQPELEKKNKTGGKQCYPICKLCLDEGKPQ